MQECKFGCFALFAVEDFDLEGTAILRDEQRRAIGHGADVGWRADDAGDDHGDRLDDGRESRGSVAAAMVWCWCVHTYSDRF